MDVVSMEWRDVLVASWPVDPAVIATRLPDGLDADTFDGRAWLSVVPFLMKDVRPFGVPASISRTFGELNLRTYVAGDAGPGVFFFNLDATDRLGVALARLLFRLPYYRAEMRVERRGTPSTSGAAARTRASRNWSSTRPTGPSASPNPRARARSRRS